MLFPLANQPYVSRSSRYHYYVCKCAIVPNCHTCKSIQTLMHGTRCHYTEWLSCQYVFPSCGGRSHTITLNGFLVTSPTHIVGDCITLLPESLQYLYGFVTFSFDVDLPVIVLYCYTLILANLSMEPDIFFCHQNDTEQFLCLPPKGGRHIVFG